MSKKHYERLASILANHKRRIEWSRCNGSDTGLEELHFDSLKAEIGTWLRADNPNFNNDMFLKACNKVS